VIVCVAANPSIDKLFEVERLIDGAIHRPVGFVQVAGGKGLNAARAAHSLGAEVQVAAILRGYAGKWLEETEVCTYCDRALTRGYPRAPLAGPKPESVPWWVMDPSCDRER
jgi:hypothetical protein